MTTTTTSSAVVATLTTITRMGEQQRDDDNGRRRRRYQVHRGVEYVQDALQLYRTIFHRKDSNGNDDEDEDGSTITSKYLDADTWTERARSGLLLLVTTTKRRKTETISSPTQGEHHHHDSSGDEDKEENTILPQQQELLPVGFCLSYPRPCRTSKRLEQQTDHDEDPTPLTSTTGYTWHIWLAGVLPKYRGQGIWTNMLLQETIHYASQQKETSRVAADVPVTIATIPKLYPNMYKSLLKEGFCILRSSNEDDGVVDVRQQQQQQQLKSNNDGKDDTMQFNSEMDVDNDSKIQLIRYPSNTATTLS